MKLACYKIVFIGLLVISLPLFAQHGWPRSIADANGQILTLPVKPKAIISLTLATDEIIFELVDRRRLKGITFLSTDAGISNVATLARGFPTRLSGEKEQIIALQPDLVLVANWKEKEFVQSLRDAGLTVFVFEAPSDFLQLRSVLRQLGTLCGESDKAELMIKAIDRRLKAVSDRVAKLEPAKRLTVLSYSFFGTTYAKGASFDSLVEAAGLINVATKAGLQGWPQLSKEQVIAMDPDIILLPSWSYEGKVKALDFRASFMKDPIFASLQAVKSGRVLNLPDAHLMANSQYMVDAVEDLARAAYPKLFK